MKKITVTETKCMGCGACVAIDSDHFEFNSNGLSTVKSNDNTESNNLANAIDSCPSGAITLDDCKCDDDCQCQGDCQCSADCNCQEAA